MRRLFRVARLQKMLGVLVRSLWLHKAVWIDRLACLVGNCNFRLSSAWSGSVARRAAVVVDFARDIPSPIFMLNVVAVLDSTRESDKMLGNVCRRKECQGAYQRLSNT